MLPTFVVEKVSRPALQPLLALFVILAGLGSTAVALSWGGPLAAGLVFILLWLLLLLRRAESSNPHASDGAREATSLASEFWRFAAPRGLAGTFQILFVWLSPILISGLRSTREAGIYAAATRYLVVGTLALQAIIQVMAPKISELFARDSHLRALSVYQTATQWLMVVTWPFYIGLAVFAPFLLQIFGQAFTSGQTALLILALAMIVSTGIGPVDSVLLMAGKSSWNLLNTVIALAVNVALNLILVPRLGMNGAAIALGASIVVNNVAPLAQVWLFLKLHPFGHGFPRVAVPAVLFYGVLGILARVMLGESFQAFLLYAVVATSLFAAALWRFRDALDLHALGDAARLKRGRKRGLAPTVAS